jgi:hypothetical protein
VGVSIGIVHAVYPEWQIKIIIMWLP